MIGACLVSKGPHVFLKSNLFNYGNRINWGLIYFTFDLILDRDMELSHSRLVHLYTEPRSESVTIILKSNRHNPSDVDHRPPFISKLTHDHDQATYPSEPPGRHPLQGTRSDQQGFGLSRSLGCDRTQSPKSLLCENANVIVK